MSATKTIYGVIVDSDNEFGFATQYFTTRAAAVEWARHYTYQGKRAPVREERDMPVRLARRLLQK